ncbi:type III pantothenate kinase [Nitzschia inconspicua]|uniref:Type III pantothenate kinase n=1 Tax=Nitzschia inconspicua TaxID=303405 RepID=A0A9K3Q452_9STRA|nr:type III pantothenate kinase [Nitzschia inconspicua]
MADATGNGSVSHSTSCIVDAVFPFDAPSIDEKLFLSISCGEDTMKWTINEGDNSTPTFSWTTPYLENTERTLPPCMTMNRFLPDQLLIYIFGSVDIKESTPKHAAKMSASRKTPALSVFLLVPKITISSDGLTDTVMERHEADIAFLFQDIPVRLLRITSHHFFPNITPQQPMLSSNRAAALYGAMMEHGSPTLLVDAGVTITYLAVDQCSSIIGGGVGTGLKLRFVALFDYCGVESYPQIHYEMFQKALEEAMQETKPLPLFENETTLSMMAAAVSEVAGQLRSIANQFLARVRSAEATTVSSNNNSNNNHNKVTIALTGDDTPFVQSLFRADCSHICKPEPGTNFPSSDKINVVADKNLASKGISHLLDTMRRLDKDTSNVAENLRGMVLGLRGARAESLVVELDHISDIYRGTIVRVFRGRNLESDSYEIVFDNAGEKKGLTQIELYDAFRLYEEVKETSDETKTLHGAGSNQKVSRIVQEQLVNVNKTVAKRKQVLDGIKESEGSLLSVLGTPTISKRGTKRNRPNKSVTGDPKAYLNKRIAKWFEDDELYFGTIDQVSRQDEKETWWHVVYDDGDEEELEIRQLRRALQDYEINKSADVKLGSGK